MHNQWNADYNTRGIICHTVCRTSYILFPAAGSHVRAAATLGGHMALMKERALQSNLVPVLVALEARIGITSLQGTK